ncbi:MAG: hypothetical protein IJ809_03410 [Clostridia bacterium]|nr:hypothetical protein [Clostridia bacterium]
MTLYKQLYLGGLGITEMQIKSYLPAVLFAFICVSSLMSSITSSMVSLEGKSFNILKSMPVKSSTIIFSKIFAALLVIVPVILLGDVIIFARFNFSILDIIMTLFASVLLPLVSETIGIIINLKYPKMDAENDAEVVKQSISSMIAVFIGMILTLVTLFGVFTLITLGFKSSIIVALGVLVYLLIYLILLLYLRKSSVKDFYNINV